MPRRGARVSFGETTLVTGAAGFIGRHVVQRLVAQGARVRATDRRADAAPDFAAVGVEFVAADLSRPDTLPPLFTRGVDRVFHLGAICNLSTPYARLREVNVLGVERITALAGAAGVTRFVHMSSTSVYGPYRGAPFTEDAPRDPQDDYGRSKRDGEDVVWQRIAEGLSATIVRPCTVYGPGCAEGAGKVFSRPTAISAIPGSGRCRLSNVRVEDVAAAAVHLAQWDGAAGHAFNVADDSHPTIEEALRLAARAFGAPIPARRLPLPVVRALARATGLVATLRGKIPDLEYDAVRYLGDDYIVGNAALKSTGYRLIHPNFEVSMRQIEEWYKERSGRAERSADL